MPAFNLNVQLNGHLENENAPWRQPGFLFQQKREAQMRYHTQFTNRKRYHLSAYLEVGYKTKHKKQHDYYNQI